jgi:hypothetical protein
MVLYAQENTCIVTIIEMKGKEQKKLKHGIEQIVKLKDVLKREIKKHLPNKFKLTIQVILLAPRNAQIPYGQIREQASKGFTILPLLHHQRAELFSYISKENKRTEIYKEEQLPHEKDEFGFIEKILVKQALPNRIEDSFYSKHFHADKERDGIYINYALSADEYAVLLLENKKSVISIKQHDTSDFKQQTSVS